MESPSQYIERPELYQLVAELCRSATRGVLVTGHAGQGKTVLLQMAERSLRAAGFTPFLLNVRMVGGIEDLGAAVLEQIERNENLHGDGWRTPVFRRSSRKSSLQSMADLRQASTLVPNPILLLDGVDEWEAPAAITPVLLELIQRLQEWKFVISSRHSAYLEAFERLPDVVRISLDGVPVDSARELIHRIAPEMPSEIAAVIADQTAGSPLLLLMATRYWRETGQPIPAVHDFLGFARALLERLSSPARWVLDRLAVVGEERLKSLQRAAGLDSGLLGHLVGIRV